MLTDFGFSTILESKSLVQSRRGRGTEAYRAPELIEDGNDGHFSFGKVSKYSDIWALGCILFKLATTGKKNAFTSDYAAIAYKQQNEKYGLPQLDSINCEFSVSTSFSNARTFRDEINSILKNCFAREPKERPTSKKLLGDFFLLKLKYSGFGG